VPTSRSRTLSTVTWLTIWLRPVLPSFDFFCN
jgi:hypothetical protein